MPERLIDGYFRFSPNIGNGSWFQPSYIPFHVEQPLEAIFVRMFRTNHEPAFRIEIFFGVSERKLSISRVPCLLATNAGIFQPQDSMNYYSLGEHSQEHDENNNYLIVFRRSNYNYLYQRKLQFCILN